MPNITIPSVTPDICKTAVSIETIDSAECVGTSLTKITNNFANIKTELDLHCVSLKTVSDELGSTTTALSAAINNLGIAPVGAIVMYDLPSGEGVKINGGPVTSDTGVITAAINNRDTIILGDSDDGSKWQVCNDADNTPDLRGQFIVSAGTHGGYAHNYTTPSHTTGGSAEHVLTVDELAVHSHGASGGGSSMVSNGTLKSGTGVEKTVYKKSGGGSVGVADAGAGAAHENRPQYTVLLFIQRIS